MRILIATNHLDRLSGSETVAFEAAKYFADEGAEVTVFANWRGRPMGARMRKAGLTVLTEPTNIRPLSYDVAYCQHHVAPLFEYARSPADVDKTAFIFGRLSPRGFMASSGWTYETALADALSANSPETAESLSLQRVALPIKVFHNAAPAEFHRPRKKPLPAKPRRVLVVTNHRCSELLAALDELQDTCEVHHIGRSGDNVAPISPSTIQRADLVISIGKTVQYALASGTPVFVYDKHGGPGYLTEANFQNAMHFNFSGRCTATRLAAAELVDHILKGFPNAVDFASSLTAEALRPFFLPHYLDSLAGLASSNADRRSRLEGVAPAFSREVLMAEYIRNTYRSRHKLMRSATDIRSPAG